MWGNSWQECTRSLREESDCDLLWRGSGTSTLPGKSFQMNKFLDKRVFSLLCSYIVVYEQTIRNPFNIQDSSFEETNQVFTFDQLGSGVS